MNYNQIKETDEKYAAKTYSRFKVALTSGSGSTLRDADGKEYIDFGSGIGVNIFGVNDAEWTAAVTGQLHRIQHTSNLYYNEPAARLSKLLCEMSGLSRVFLCNSGAEANECAIKVARKYSFVKYGEGRNGIITLKNSFHGRTVTTLSATGQDSFHTNFMPFTPGFCHISPDFDELKAAADGSICALMLEVVQGEGGVVPLPPEFVEGAVKLCREQDILLIIDEIQTGNGRTGKLYGYMHYGAAPDIVTTAKGLGGGLPIGAALLGERVAETLKPGDHGSTFGANPVACAGALSVVERLNQELFSAVLEKSDYIVKKLSEMPNTSGVTGMGLMLGIALKEELNAKTIAEKCAENGLLILTAKDRLRLLPPLNITYLEIDRGLGILNNILLSAA